MDISEELIKESIIDISKPKLMRRMPKEAKSILVPLMINLSKDVHYVNGYKYIFIEQYIPSNGKVWKACIYNSTKIDMFLKSNKKTYKMDFIMRNAILSVCYYNNVSRPYYEIWDRKNIKVFYHPDTCSAFLEMLNYCKQVLTDKL